MQKALQLLSTQLQLSQKYGSKITIKYYYYSGWLIGPLPKISMPWVAIRNGGGGGGGGGDGLGDYMTPYSFLWLLSTTTVTRTVNCTVNSVTNLQHAD